MGKGKTHIFPTSIRRMVSVDKDTNIKTFFKVKMVQSIEWENIPVPSHIKAAI